MMWSVLYNVFVTCMLLYMSSSYIGFAMMGHIFMEPRFRTSALLGFPSAAVTRIFPHLLNHTKSYYITTSI